MGKKGKRSKVKKQKAWTDGLAYVDEALEQDGWVTVTRLLELLDGAISRTPVYEWCKRGLVGRHRWRKRWYVSLHDVRKHMAKEGYRFALPAGVGVHRHEVFDADHYLDPDLAEAEAIAEPVDEVAAEAMAEQEKEPEVPALFGVSVQTARWVKHMAVASEMSEQQVVEFSVGLTYQLFGYAPLQRIVTAAERTFGVDTNPK